PWWEFRPGRHGPLSHVLQPVRDPVGAMHCALRRGLVPRGICQPMALPTSEVATAKYSATAAPTLEAHQPLPPAAKPGRGVAEGYEIIDVDPLPLWTPTLYRRRCCTPAGSFLWGSRIPLRVGRVQAKVNSYLLEADAFRLHRARHRSSICKQPFPNFSAGNLRSSHGPPPTRWAVTY